MSGANGRKNDQCNFNLPVTDVLPMESLEVKQLLDMSGNNVQHDNTFRLERCPVSKSTKHSIRPSPPMSRNNSFDKTPLDVVSGLGYTAPSSPIRDSTSVASIQTCSSVINIECKPLPTTKLSHPRPPPNTGHITCATNHFDPLGTPKSKLKGMNDVVQALANSRTTPMPEFSLQMTRTVSESCFSSLGHDDTNSKPKHFDPMGTPKCNPKTVEGAMNTMNAMKNNGFFPLPDLDIGDVPTPVVISQHSNQHQRQVLVDEDPFDEIVRHGRG